MARLRTVSPNAKGWTRRRAGRGFVYLDADGQRLPDEDVDRIRSLVIPPAWEDVWICPHANGHIQAVGVDAAGRRQYLYHPDWRTERDKLKFDRVAEVARKLPAARASVLEHIALDGMPVERAGATAVRLLDLGYFRIGSDAYADSNGFLTLLSDGHRLTGAYALGPEAGEWLQQATLAIRAHVPLEVLTDTIQPFPTFSEVFASALKALRSSITADQQTLRAASS